MQINNELLGILVTVIVQGLYLAFKVGKFEEKLKTLEEKQDKHNNLIERMVRVEDSSKSAHKRLDEIVMQNMFRLSPKASNQSLTPGQAVVDLPE